MNRSTDDPTTHDTATPAARKTAAATASASARPNASARVGRADRGTRAARRGRDAAAVVRPEDRLAVRLLQLVDVVIARLYHRTTVRAAQRLPRRGPAILVCNHISGLDPLLIQSVCKRAIVWMMATEYYEIKSLTWMFKMIDAIPVDRGGRDMAATRAALRALADGRVLGIFPEGKIEPTRDLLPFQTGVALMAIKTKVPVYPVYLDGTQRGQSMLRAFLTPNEATLTFGPPVEFDRSGTSREVLEAATARIQQAVETLRRQRAARR